MPQPRHKDFIDGQSRKALITLLESKSEEETTEAAVALSGLFGSPDKFKRVIEEGSSEEARFIESFRNNMELLVQKTWVEKPDVEIRARVLFKINEFKEQMTERKYDSCYKTFHSIANDIVYLMFGDETEEDDFAEYAYRLDPEFGSFWWYVTSLPQAAPSSEHKSRILTLLGMYFLANY